MQEGEAPKRRRQHRSVAEKRRILEATRVAGVSVAEVARKNGVNANQVYAWRRLEAAGQLGEAAQSGALLAVRLRAEPEEPRKGHHANSAAMELECGRARLRIEAGADPALLRIVLEHLVG
jgi:transposase